MAAHANERYELCLVQPKWRTMQINVMVYLELCGATKWQPMRNKHYGIACAVFDVNKMVAYAIKRYGIHRAVFGATKTETYANKRYGL